MTLLLAEMGSTRDLSLLTPKPRHRGATEQLGLSQTQGLLEEVGSAALSSLGGTRSPWGVS